MYRKTYVKINHDNLTHNAKEIINKYPEYKYYIGVVKNNAYHHGIKIVNALKKGGINYFAVSSLEEALELRKYNTETPILILEPIDIEYIHDCINNNITITVESEKYIKELEKIDLKYELKIHLKIDTGMNRLGFKNRKELDETVKKIQQNPKLVLEGIYSHFATSGITDKQWDDQLQCFKELTKNIDLSSIPIIHLGRSQTLVNHSKIDFCNGIRLGIILYGFAQSQSKDLSLKGRIRTWKNNKKCKKYKISKTTTENDLNLNTAFSLYSTVISIRKVYEDDLIGYNNSYKIKEDGYLATIPIGYADGVNKSFKYVSINQKKYPIVADTMDMLSVLVDENVKIGTEVEIFGNDILIKEVTKSLGINAYHLFNQIQNRVPRIHISKDEAEETKY